MRRPRARGFTMLELLIALAILATLLVVAFGGLRVAIAAWTRGEERVDAHQHLRGLTLVLARALGATYPYRAPVGPAPTPVFLFNGKEDRIEFVTQAPPLPAAVPIAFTAVVVGIETDDAGPALVVRQRPLPNRDPFTEAAVSLRDPLVEQIQFAYMGEGGGWQDTWDGEEGLPRAIRVTLPIKGDRGTPPTVTVSLRPESPQ